MADFAPEQVLGSGVFNITFSDPKAQILNFKAFPDLSFPRFNCILNRNYSDDSIALLVKSYNQRRGIMYTALKTQMIDSVYFWNYLDIILAWLSL